MFIVKRLLIPNKLFIRNEIQMAPSLKRLQIQSEAEAHFLFEYHRGNIFLKLKETLKDTQELLIDTHDTLKELNRKYLKRLMTLCRNSTGSTY